VRQTPSGSARLSLERQIGQMKNFDSWFASLTAASSAPHDWQRSLSASSEPRSRMIRIPTGMGKTLGVFAAWSWHRIHLRNRAWPRRLVWCLPMRVLVEQTEAVLREALERVGLLLTGDDGAGRTGSVGVHQLMGGADPGDDWNLFPEDCAVLVGTQDMLLSRALNRGYGSGRARWPLEFGLLSHDALWVMDEVQLMDVGLATSAQLQAYHDDDCTKGFRPRLTWWMSATLQPQWLETVDTVARFPQWASEPCAIPPNLLGTGITGIRKSLASATIPHDEAKAFAERALEEHAKLSDESFGRITLVICNTVQRAGETYDALISLGRTEGLELVHGRFRPHERAVWRERFLSREACAVGVDRIIVATQVVEAGVDISAGCVVTELAPWPNLVQRFGRCARYGGTGHVVVVDRGREKSQVLPYDSTALDGAWAVVGQLDDIGIERLERFEHALDQNVRDALYPYIPTHLLLRREFDELFDTTADLTGGDLDIARFIRSRDDRDLQVFWLDVDKGKSDGLQPKPSRKRSPRREELCPVQFLRARNWLCGRETKEQRKPKLRPGVRAWVWDFIEGDWQVADRSNLNPGRIVCVAAEVGGYRQDRGFDPDAKGPVVIVPDRALPQSVANEIEADRSNGGDELSASKWKTIACHTGEVVEQVQTIADALELPEDTRRVLAVAARWHDIGKAHPAFQGAIRGHEKPARNDLAKAPDEAWLRPPGTYRTPDGQDVRLGLRHELASALAMFAVLERHEPQHPALLGLWVEVFAQLNQAIAENPSGTSPTREERAVLDCTADEFDLAVYLVASHHGKVRAALHASPKDQDYRAAIGDDRGLPIRGIRTGDELHEVSIEVDAPPISALTLCLDPATLGLSRRTGRSWRERTLGLQERFGPGGLAWLEALLIAADRRASRLTTPDPQLASLSSEQK
jgi:CRISPR-associated endonuclease/helicase Cas3